MAKTEKYYKLETNSRYFTKFYKNQPLKKKQFYKRIEIKGNFSS